jgi:hypothetical protein
MKFFKTKSSGYINLDKVMQISEGREGGLSLVIVNGAYHNTDAEEAKRILAFLNGTDAVITQQ